MKTSSAQTRLLKAQEAAMEANLAAEQLKELLAIAKTQRPVHSQAMKDYVVEWMERKLDVISRRAAELTQAANNIEFWNRGQR